MALSIDLNELPAESWQFEDDAVPIKMQHKQITMLESPGSVSSPIDTDSTDDDDVSPPSSPCFPLTKSLPRWKQPFKVAIDESQSRRKQPITVVIDDLDSDCSQSGVVEEPVTTLSLNSQNLNTQVSVGRTIIGCDLCANEMNKGLNPNPFGRKEVSAPCKKHEVSAPSKKRKVSAPCKKGAIICPLCLNSLNEPSTTICGHLFCRSCIETAISKQKNCPTCLRKLSKRNFHRIYI